jgi:hypothetical protein
VVKVKSFSIVEELVIEYEGKDYKLTTRDVKEAFKNMPITNEAAKKLKTVNFDLHAHLCALLHLKCSFKQERLL